MPYMMIENFSGGLDLRKSALTSEPGTLRTLKNAFITAGGEIEKRKTLTSVGVLPSGTHGLGYINNKIAVFGTAASPSGPLPANVEYRQLNTAKTIQRILDVTRFGPGIYVVARMADGTIEHFFDGALVSGTGGTNVLPHKTKLYSVDKENLRFSAIQDPEDWSGTGSGIIDVTTVDAGASEIIGLEQYYGHLALFGRNSVQIWSMDPDPALNTQQQVLGNIGLVAPNAVARYGNGDVLFLSHTGLRSLRARDSSNAAVLNDIGSPVDPLVRELRGTLMGPSCGCADRITAIVDPLTGHFWLTWDSRVVVLSYYPNTNITAWSVFEFPLVIEHIVLAGSRLVVRSGNQLFIYGTLPTVGSPFDPNAPIGNDPSQYDAQPVEIVTPLIGLQQPATDKEWTGLDVACEGTWEVSVTPDHARPETWTKVATVTGSTFNHGRIPLDMRGTHMAVRLRSVGSGFARLSALGVHYEGGDAG